MTSSERKYSQKTEKSLQSDGNQRELLIREIPLIQRAARRNERDDLRFRNFLKTQLDLSNEKLDAVVKETTASVWGQIDCLTCGHCCKSLQIEVDDKDIQRLSVRLGMSIAQFNKKYVKLAEDHVKHFAATPCTFLGPDNRCAVYEDRPQSCRDFPYLDNSHFRSRSIIMMENTAVCPIVYNVWQALKRKFWLGKRS